MLISIKAYISRITFLIGNEKKNFLWLIPFFLLSTFLDLIGIGLFVAFMSLLTQGDGSEILTFFNIIKDTHSIEWYIAVSSSILLLIFFIKSILAIYVNRKILKTCFNYGAKLRTYLAYLYQGMDYAEYSKRSSSEYIYNIQTLAGQFATSTIQSIVRIISDGIVVVSIFIFLAINSGAAFYMFVIILVTTSYLYDKFFKQKNYHYGLKVNKESSKMIQVVQESMHGYKENNIYDISNYFNNLVFKYSTKLANARVKAAIINTSSKYIIELVMVFFIVSISIISYLFEYGSEYILTTIAMFGIAGLRLLPSIVQIITSTGKLRYSNNAVNIIYGDIKSYSHNYLSFDNYFSVNKVKDRAEVKVESFKTLILKNISFSYMGKNKFIYKNVNLAIDKGMVVGFVGKSGSGKTTLLDLILGFLKPVDGSILYNGKNLDKDVKIWTSKVAYMPQEVFIVNGTIRENIAFGIPYSEIDDDLIDSAVKKSQLKPLISRLESGLDHNIGERGIKLSGGERQRIALARAIYHRREILIMDESTSALDSETERQVVNEIRMLRGDKTIIIVAHNYDTLKYCDVIYEVTPLGLKNMGNYSDLCAEKKYKDKDDK